MTRVVVVGAGKMGSHHARVFAQADGAELVGVLDIDARLADEVARAHDAVALRTYDEAIERADLVVIATPTSLHFSQTRRALAAGRAVLVEKPLAASGADARALCGLARESGAKLFVGHSERFNAVVRALAAETSQSEVLHVGTRRMAFAPSEELCVNLAVHDIDLIALLARAPVEIASASGDADTAEIALVAGSATARAIVARRAAARVRAIVVRTARETFHGDLLARRLERDGVQIILDDGEPLALQAAAMLAAMRGEPTLVATGEDGVRAVEVAERAASSLADQRVNAAE